MSADRESKSLDEMVRRLMEVQEEYFQRWILGMLWVLAKDGSVSREDLVRLGHQADENGQAEISKSETENSEEYRMLLREIRMRLIDDSVPVLKDPAAREFIRRLHSGKKLPLEEKFEFTLKHLDKESKDQWVKDLRGEMDSQELLDYWEKRGYGCHFIGLDWVKGMMETGVLVSGTQNIPPHLAEYIREARECVAMGLDRAAAVMCRTILQICLNDIYWHQECGRSGNMPREETWMMNLGDKPLGAGKYEDGAISLVVPYQSDKVFHKCLKKFNRDCSNIVHPSSTKSPDSSLLTSLFHEMLVLVHEVYEKYGSPEGNQP